MAQTSLGGYLDNLIGEEGLKSDITINLTPSTYITLGVTLVSVYLVIILIRYLANS